MLHVPVAIGIRIRGVLLMADRRSLAAPLVLADRGVRVRCPLDAVGDALRGSISRIGAWVERTACLE